MTARRAIRTGIVAGDGCPNTWRLYAECPDVTTDVLIMGAAIPMPADGDAFAASEWPRLLLAEHLDRCADCAAWRTRATA